MRPTTMIEVAFAPTRAAIDITTSFCQCTVEETGRDS